MRSISLLSSILLSLCISKFAFAEPKSSAYIVPVEVQYRELSKPLQKQIDCLAENIYREAGNESQQGRMAVAFVTLNRLSSGHYGGDICGVVKQKSNGVCQFSWVCATGRLTNIYILLYNDIRQLAINVVMNYEVIRDVTYGATYYHADHVNPNWKLSKTTKIGRHIFYKNNRDVVAMNKEFKYE